MVSADLLQEDVAPAHVELSSFGLFGFPGEFPVYISLLTSSFDRNKAVGGGWRAGEHLHRLDAFLFRQKVSTYVFLSYAPDTETQCRSQYSRETEDSCPARRR